MHVNVFAWRYWLAGSGFFAITLLCSGAAAQSISHRNIPSQGHIEGARSWVEPGASGQPLLYVPDFFQNRVDVYTYPGGALVGRLTGLNGPQGECVDQAQNIWIAEQGSAQIVEYAHGGTHPIATLSDAGEIPVGCSVDPLTGNLAVTNYAQTNGNEGSVAVYKRAAGSPHLYYDGRQMFWTSFCAYDDRGNLFVDGWAFPVQGSVYFQYAELPAGASKFTNITLRPQETIDWTDGIHWDGSHIVLGNLLKGVLYRTSGAKIVSTIHARGARGAVDFFVEAKTLIIGKDAGRPALGLWNYPAGGKAVQRIRLPKRRDPIAEAVVSE